MDKMLEIFMVFLVIAAAVYAVVEVTQAAVTSVTDAVTGVRKQIQEAEAERIRIENAALARQKELEAEKLAAEVEAAKNAAPATTAWLYLVRVGGGIALALCFLTFGWLGSRWTVNWVRTQSHVVERTPNGVTLMFGNRVLKTGNMPDSVIDMGAEPDMLERADRFKRWLVDKKRPPRLEPTPAKPMIVTEPQMYLEASRQGAAVAGLRQVFGGVKGVEDVSRRNRAMRGTGLFKALSRPSVNIEVMGQGQMTPDALASELGHTLPPVRYEVLDAPEEESAIRQEESGDEEE